MTFSILLFTPVLAHPHWGTFDDADLILQQNLAPAAQRSLSAYLEMGMRLGIFYWSTVVWRLFPENQLGFYSVNCLLLATASVITYINSYRISKNLTFSAFATCLLFFAPGIFEVIYTLDKQESYLPLLFSVIISCFLFIPQSKRGLIVSALAIPLLGTCAYLSKETSSIMVIFTGAFLATTATGAWRDKTETAKRRFLQVGLLFSVTVWPLILLRLYFDVLNPTPDRYVHVHFDIQSLTDKTLHYVQAMPAYFVAFTWCTIVAATSIRGSKNSLLDADWQGFAALWLSSLAGTVALISFDTFKGLFLYIWLPIYVFLLPCLAFSISQIWNNGSQMGKKLSASVMVLLAVAALARLPDAILQAQFQFGMDDLTAKLTDKVGELVSKSKTEVVGAMPVYLVDSYEIPENLECFVRSKLVPKYFSPDDEKTGQFKFSMLNFLSTKQEDTPSQFDRNIYNLAPFRGREFYYSTACPPDYLGWNGYQYMSGRVRKYPEWAKTASGKYWVKRPFGSECFLLVPYGNLPYERIIYRGSGLFASTVQAYLYAFPQLEFKELGGVERRIHGVGRETYQLGWKILKVTSAQPIVAPPDCLDGWVKSGDRFLYKFDPRLPVLRILTSQPVVGKWSVHDERGPLGDVKVNVVGNQRVADIMLPRQTKQHSGITVDASPATGNASLHIDGIKFVAN